MLRKLRSRLVQDQDGFTIFEVTIVSAILLVVVGACVGTMLSLTRTEQRTNALVSNEQDARFVLTDLARDIRAANPMQPLPGNPAVGAYRSQLQLASGPTGSQTIVRWVYDTAAGSPTQRSLLRQTIDPLNGTVLTSTPRLGNIRNAERGVHMFGFTSQSGVDLVDAGLTANVATCAIKVSIVITADSNPGPEPFTVHSDVHLRNRTPGAVACG